MLIFVICLTIAAGLIGFLVGQTQINMELVRHATRLARQVTATEKMVDGFEADIVEFAADGDPLARQLLYRIAEHKRELENRRDSK